MIVRMIGLRMYSYRNKHSTVVNEGLKELSYIVYDDDDYITVDQWVWR